MSGRGHRPDVAHHHPAVRRAGLGTWAWRCECGGASCRAPAVPVTWREAVVAALHHATALV
jgi:hypothetical protein